MRKLASDLKDTLGELDDVHAELQRSEMGDAGTTLSLEVDRPSAIVLLVKTLGAWLVRNNKSSVTITKSDGTVVNMTSNDVPEAIAAIGKDLNSR
jgi:hypothetical protein